ncbi:MAG: hypothetical protein FH751_13240 [Firmicutes bacterium]|nr:hypothetical protein [Bacillota bacterium]
MSKYVGSGKYIVIKIIVLLIITSSLLGCYQKIDKTTEKSVINPDEEKKDINGIIKKETEHFIFNYKIYDKKAVDDLAKILEENYERIVNDIKPTIEPSTIKVYVYPSIDEFHKAVYKPDASDGFVGYTLSATEFAIVSPNNPGNVHNYEDILKTAVHEFTHIVVGIVRMPPRWLNESIALYEAE